MVRYLFYTIGDLIYQSPLVCKETGCLSVTIIFELSKYRVGINYRRISLRHNLSRKFRKIVKLMSIIHSGHWHLEWHKEVRKCLNEHLPGRWVGRAAATDNTFCTWSPRSPDLTVCDFFLWGLVKDNVYAPPLPKAQPELRERINTAIGNVTQDMLGRVLAGLGVSSGHLPCHAWGAHRMHLRSLWNCKHSSFKW